MYLIWATKAMIRCTQCFPSVSDWSTLLKEDKKKAKTCNGESLVNGVVGTACEGQKSVLMSSPTSRVSAVSCKAPCEQAGMCKGEVLCVGTPGCAFTRGSCRAPGVLPTGMCSHSVPALRQETAPGWSGSAVYAPWAVCKSLGAHLCEAAF